MHFLHRPALLDKGRGEPVQQLRVCRAKAQQSPVVRRLDEARAEVTLPDAVHFYAARQRMLRARKPLRQLQTTAAVLIRDDDLVAAQHRQKVAGDLVAERLRVAANMHPAVFGLCIFDGHDGRRLGLGGAQVGHRLLGFDDCLPGAVRIERLCVLGSVMRSANRRMTAASSSALRVEGSGRTSPTKRVACLSIARWTPCFAAICLRAHRRAGAGPRGDGYEEEAAYVRQDADAFRRKTLLPAGRE